MHENENDALKPEFAIIYAMYRAHKASGTAQKQPAKRTGITRGDASKIEIGEANPTLNTPKRLTSGMGMKLELEFAPVLP